MTVNSHEQQLERLRGLQHHAAAGGGDKAVARHHEAGKLTARERLDRLFDRNTFIELNDLAESQCTDFGMDRRKVPGDGVVVGHGLIDGRRVFAYAQDVTVLGGLWAPSTDRKSAGSWMKPQGQGPGGGAVRLGGRPAPRRIFRLQRVAGMFYRNTAASGVIPQISCIMGPCAGVSVYSPALTDFVCNDRKAESDGDHRPQGDP